MNRYVRYFIGMLAAITLVVGSSSAVWGCKYSVRDVAFVDLGTQPYLLRLGVLDGDTDLSKLIRAKLKRTNIRIEQVASANSQAVLIAPDGRELKLDFKRDNFNQGGAGQFLDGLIHSPLRERIKALSLKHHCVVLVVEGSNGKANQQGKLVADRAAKAIGAALLDLPKPIENGPVVVTVDAVTARAERVALWSLGIELDRKHADADADADAASISIAVIYGRLRRLGPVLMVPPTAEADLIANMTWVGQDCECELDRSWMTGSMMPHRWTGEDEAAAVKVLEFDPGSPLVRSEIQRILARGPSSTGQRHDRIGVVRPIDPLLGYSEIEIEATGGEAGGEMGTDNAAANADKAGVDDTAKAQAAGAGGSAPADVTVDAVATKKDGQGQSIVMWIVVGLAVVMVLVVGVRILNRKEGGSH